MGDGFAKGQRRLTRRGLFSAGAAAAVGSTAAVAWPARCHGKFYPGATLLDIDLGGLSRTEALQQVRTRLAPFEELAITYRLQDRVWRASIADLGLTIDYESSLDQAWEHGRGDDLRERYSALMGARKVVEPLTLTLDNARFDGYLAGLERDIAKPARDATIAVRGNQPRITQEQVGVRLDSELAREQTIAAIKSLQSTVVNLTTVPIMPSVVASDLSDAAASISTLIAREVRVDYGDSSWTVTTDDLTAALLIPKDPVHKRASLDPVLLRESLSRISDEVNHPPRNAGVAWDDGLYATQESYDGVEVDLEQLTHDVISAAATNERDVELPLIYIPPAVDSGNLDALGIATRIARGDSSFSGSSDARATNVAVAARHVSQTLIAAGETFSFNDALGPITVDEGYVEGKIILGDWYASDIGGGVCQVSTTVFRAALLAGLPFVEWHPHSFRLGFYELDGWPAGMDAAIYQPNDADEAELDLLFTNPTESWMLLQLRIEGETIVAEIFGEESKLDVRISEPAFSDPIAPPQPIERSSTDLTPGAREQIQVAQPGVTVTMTRDVFAHGHVVSEDTFVSPYQAQPDIFLVGKTSD